MDPRRFSAIAHDGMVLWNPLDEGTVRSALSRLPEDAASLLDVGCGRAEALAWWLEARPDAVATGVDPSPWAMGAARESLGRRGLLGRAHLVEAPYAPDGSLHDVVLCLGALHAVGGLEGGLETFHGVVRPGGRLLLAEGYWRREPDPAYLELLAAGRDEYRTHEGNVDAARAHGWEVVEAIETSLEAWDRYEEAYAANVRTQLAEHPDDPDAEAMRARIDSWHAGYRRWGRETLGFGLYAMAPR